MAVLHLFVASTILVAHCAWADIVQGRVVAISDGDTVKILDATNTQHTIRLAGIDAPESRQAFGQRSKQHLSMLVFKREVTADCSKTDKYRREICKILLDGVDANLEQVKAGMAWHYKQYAKEQSAQDRALYDSAESSARAGRLGLWADREPVPPWVWRHRR